MYVQHSCACSRELKVITETCMLLLFFYRILSDKCLIVLKCICTLLKIMFQCCDPVNLCDVYQLAYNLYVGIFQFNICRYHFFRCCSVQYWIHFFSTSLKSLFSISFYITFFYWPGTCILNFCLWCWVGYNQRKNI